MFHAAKDDGSKESNRIKEILGMDKVPGVVLYKPDGEIDKYSGKGCTVRSLVDRSMI